MGSGSASDSPTATATVSPMSEALLPRIWCCASAEAPVVAVFARCHASVRPAKEYADSSNAGNKSGTRWSCVLKWDWKTGALTEGAWTSMELRPLRSMVSACGEYHLFHAKTYDEGPFSAKLGPRYAVARLPWLAPLTHPQSFGPGGAGLSQHALSKAQQERLWAMFGGFFWRQTDDEWPRHLAAGPVNPTAAASWRALTVDDPLFEGTDFREHLLPKKAAESADEGAPAALPPHLIAITPIAVQATSGTQVSLIAAVPRSPSATGEPGTGWNIWEGQLRFFVLVRTNGSARIEALNGVRWAKPTPDGRLLTASADCRLRVLRWGASAWQILQEHDLSTLKPNPKSPPREALAGLR